MPTELAERPVAPKRQHQETLRLLAELARSTVLELRDESPRGFAGSVSLLRELNDGPISSARTRATADILSAFVKSLEDHGKPLSKQEQIRAGEELWLYSWTVGRKDCPKMPSLNRALDQWRDMSLPELYSRRPADVRAAKCRELAYSYDHEAVDYLVDRWISGTDRNAAALLGQSENPRLAVKDSLKNYLEQGALYGMLAIACRIDGYIRNLTTGLGENSEDPFLVALSESTDLMTRATVTTKLQTRIDTGDLGAAFGLLHWEISGLLRVRLRRNRRLVPLNLDVHVDNGTSNPRNGFMWLPPNIWERLSPGPGKKPFPVDKKLTFLASRNCLESSSFPAEYSELVKRRQKALHSSKSAEETWDATTSFLSMWSRGAVGDCSVLKKSSEIDSIWAYIPPVHAGLVAWLRADIDDRLALSCKDDVKSLALRRPEGWPNQKPFPDSLVDDTSVATISGWEGTLVDYSLNASNFIVALSLVGARCRNKLPASTIRLCLPGIYKWTKTTNGVHATRSRITKSLGAHLLGPSEEEGSNKS